MPPKKVTKLENKEEPKKIEVKKVEIKKVEVKKEEKSKKNEVKDNKKWAEVTDDEYHDDDDVQEEHSSEKSESESDGSEEEDDGVLDEEALLETLKNVSSGMKPGQNGAKSIVDFDYDEVHLMDSEELSDYDTNTLLKVLMVRGTKTNNPILWSKSRTLLRLLNFEIKPNQPFHGHDRNRNYDRNPRGGYRGGRGGYRGDRGGFRGEHAGDHNERNDRYKPRNENNQEKDTDDLEPEANFEKKEEGNWRGKKNWRGGRK